MAIVHVAAIVRHHVRADRGGAFAMTGTWIDEDQETTPWESTLGKPTFRYGWETIERDGHIYRVELYRQLVPWLAQIR